MLQIREDSHYTYIMLLAIVDAHGEVKYFGNKMVLFLIFN